MNEVCDARQSESIAPVRWSAVVRRWVWETILTLYRCHLYRHVMRVAHRYNWHYAPPHRIPEPNHNGLKVNNHWCQWCGLRGHTWEYDKSAPLSPNGPDQALRPEHQKP